MQSKTRNIVNFFLGAVMIVTAVFFLEPVRLLALNTIQNVLHKQTKVVDWQLMRLFALDSYVFILTVTAFLYLNIKDEKLFSRIFYSALFVFIIFTVFNIVYKACWAFGDDVELITTVGMKKMTVPDAGRSRLFWHYDYNFLVFTPWNKNVNAFYITNAVYFAIFSAYLILVARSVILESAGNSEMAGLIKRGVLVLVFAALFLLEQPIAMFFHIIYPEKLLVMFGCIFIFHFLYGIKNDNPWHLLTAFIAACFMTYLKEPVFGMLCVAGIFSIIFLRKKSKWVIPFAILLFINSVIYVYLWYNLSLKVATSNYAALNQGKGWGEIFVAMVKCAPFLVLMMIFTLFCAVRKFIKNKSIDEKDVLFLSGGAYFMAFFLLKMPGDYYLFLSYFLCLPAFLHYAAESVYQNEDCKKWKAALFVFILACYGWTTHYKYATESFAKNHFRQDEWHMMQTFAQSAKDKDNVYWLNWPQGGYKNREEHDLTRRQWILNSFIPFLNNGDMTKSPFTEVIDVPDSIGQNDILFIVGLKRTKDELDEKLDAAGYRSVYEFSTFYEEWYLQISEEK